MEIRNLAAMIMFTAVVYIASWLSLVHAVEVGTVKRELYVVDRDVAPDGFKRSAVVGGFTLSTASLPGPLIAGRKGPDLRFDIEVINRLNDASMLTETSIHFHGMFQRHTNWADGATFVTQCPIISGHNFNYNFSVPDQAGTFWWHAHDNLQYCDGLRGPLVIYDDDDPHKTLYDIDDEGTIITLMDWFHSLAVDVAAEGARTRTSPSPDSTLINGKGRWPGDPTAELAVLTVEHGKRYRFRLVSMACDANYKFSIDAHNLTIIEVDGESTELQTVNQIQIFTAQRVSFVVSATRPIGNYWIRAQPNHGMDMTFRNGLNSAILRYKGADTVEPRGSQAATAVAPMIESALRPLSNPAAPGKPYPRGADLVLDLYIDVAFIPSLVFTINNKTFIPPSVPVLLQILSGTKSAQELLSKDGIYELPLNKVIELNLIGQPGAIGGPHPLHLHGHTFSVVKSYDSPHYNFVNPVRRDTTVVVAGSTTTIRFTTDNPGPWFFHCHIDFHLQLGLALVFAEAVPEIKDAVPVPDAWKDLCPLYQNASLNYSRPR
ncbi:laccase [Mycena floridula]|nr:laccase [Mycena floridula]